MDSPPAIVINDPGGYVWAHEALGRKYAKDGSKLVVVYCASACLNLIALVPKENVCFRRSAWVGYHTGAQSPSGIESPTTMRWERGREWIARGYRECGK